MRYKYIARESIIDNMGEIVGFIYTGEQPKQNNLPTEIIGYVEASNIEEAEGLAKRVIKRKNPNCNLIRINEVMTDE